MILRIWFPQAKSRNSLKNIYFFRISIPKIAEKGTILQLRYDVVYLCLKFMANFLIKKNI